MSISDEVAVGAFFFEFRVVRVERETFEALGPLDSLWAAFPLGCLDLTLLATKITSLSESDVSAAFAVPSAPTGSNLAPAALEVLRAFFTAYRESEESLSTTPFFARPTAEGFARTGAVSGSESESRLM